MPIRECTMRDWREEMKKEEQSFAQAMAGLKVKKCPECKKNAYSYDPTFQQDPGCCAECGGREGDIRL
jgi:hypothetical protein